MIQGLKSRRHLNKGFNIINKFVFFTCGFAGEETAQDEPIRWHVMPAALNSPHTTSASSGLVSKTNPTSSANSTASALSDDNKY